MLYTIISILSLLIVALSFAIYNILQKLEKYEDIIEENDKFIEAELQKNEALLEALRQIDNSQMFEKDDDVGSIFYQIKETIEKFKQR
jgi:predicted Holliday junction resolvase-like endonuclease